MRKLSQSMVESFRSCIRTADAIELSGYIKQLQKEIDDYNMYHIGEKDPMYNTILGEALSRYVELTGHEYPDIISAKEAEKMETEARHAK